MLGVTGAAARLQVSRTTVYDWVDRRTLLAWKSTRRGLTIPAEQILGPGKVVDGLAGVLDVIDDPELAWAFLTQEWPFDDEAAFPLEMLKAGRIQEVIDAAPGFGAAFSWSRAAYPRNRVRTALLTAELPSCFRIVPRRHLVSPLGTVPSDSRFCSRTADYTVLYAEPDFITAFIETVLRDRFTRRRDREIRLAGSHGTGLGANRVAAGDGARPARSSRGRLYANWRADRCGACQEPRRGACFRQGDPCGPSRH